MKRTWKKATALFVTLVFLTAAIAIPAGAVTGRSSLYLSCYRAWLTPVSGAKLNVNVDVQAVDDMDDVGSTKIVIYESADGGDNWSKARTYYSALEENMLDHGTVIYYDTAVVHQGTAGYKYYAVVTVYAGDSTGSDSRDYVTATVTARN